MKPISLNEVIAQLEGAYASGDMQSFEFLLWPALDQMPDIGALWFYAGIYFAQTGRNSLAGQCFQKSYELDPNPNVLANLGACLRYVGKVDEARAVLEKAIDRNPVDINSLINLAGTYVNEGNPEKGIEYGERAVAVDEGRAEGKFNLALLHLEAGNFARGFDLYTSGKHRHREERDYFTPETEPPVLTPELHARLTTHPVGAASALPVLIVWGEQGIGDECMFATMLLDVIKDYDVILDCHPRLEELHRNSAWAHELQANGRPVRIVPTRKDRGEPLSRPVGVLASEVSAKAAIGDLCRIYRRNRADFGWNGPTYSAPPVEASIMRQQLEAMAGGRKIIGLATRGGTPSTNTRYRRLPQKQLEQLFSRKDCFYVGLDYEDMNQVSMWAEQHYPGSFYWPASVNFAWTYEHVAALVAATDAVITVPQSVMHLACGMGHPTHVLVPSAPDWRLGISGNFCWYPGSHVTLHRQKADDWEACVASALADIERLSLKAAA